METTMPEVRPGQVWWCQGSYLEFEWHLKTRPVLILKVEDDSIQVAILTSKSHLGSIPVTHRKGVSYLTGKVATVPREALLNDMGEWEGFSEFLAGKSSSKKGCTSLFLAAFLLLLLITCIGSILLGLK